MELSFNKSLSEQLTLINAESSSEAMKRFQDNPHPSQVVLTIQLIFNPLREFIQKYFIWKMYKEGTHGAAASILYAFYHFLIVAKYLQKALRE